MLDFLGAFSKATNVENLTNNKKKKSIKILKSTVIDICGIIAGVGGFFMALQFPGQAEQLYVMAVVAVVALIIPGLVVYIKNKS